MLDTEQTEPVCWHKKPNGMINSPAGFLADGLYAGFRRKTSRPDLGCLISEVPAAAAGMFTKNRFCAAPVQVTRRSLKKNHLLQGVICNSGQANAGTGQAGMAFALDMQRQFARKMEIPDPDLVAVLSTGVIGVLPDPSALQGGIERCSPSRSSKAGSSFSRAILTTDQVAKTSCYTLEIDGREVTIAGNAKGSGMIHPDMATMLAFLTTDAAVEPGCLRDLLSVCVDRSFHRISVDGDTSTNDSVLLLANGRAGNAPLTPEHPKWRAFAGAAQALCLDLAHAIVRDAEGAHKFLEVEVFGAPSEREAAALAKSVISSNLFKSAMYGEDMNWGRINCALGYAGVEIDFGKIDLIAGRRDSSEAIVLLRDGEVQPFSESAAAALLSQYEIVFSVDLHQGTASAKAWGCDLSYDYIHINAAKRS